MTNDELEKLLARMISAGELLQEIADEAKAAVRELQTARPPSPEMTAIAARIETLEREMSARLPRRPRPWNPMYWLTAPPPAWWIRMEQNARVHPPPGWAVRLARALTPWPVVRTLTGVVILALLLIGFENWTTPFLHDRQADGQWWMGLRLTWW